MSGEGSGCSAKFGDLCPQAIDQREVETRAAFLSENLVVDCCDADGGRLGLLHCFGLGLIPSIAEGAGKTLAVVPIQEPLTTHGAGFSVGGFHDGWAVEHGLPLLC